MRYKIEFELFEDVEKQEKDFNVTEEQKKAFEENKDMILKQHIKDLENAIKEMFTYKDYEYPENIKIKQVE